MKSVIKSLLNQTDAFWLLNGANTTLKNDFVILLDSVTSKIGPLIISSSDDSAAESRTRVARLQTVLITTEPKVIFGWKI